ncbi:MAG: Sec-independent protein translocase protein TatB [Geminicoccaceae bacterium]
MFDIGWSEMAVILMVALIVIGPKDLPRVARTVGKWTAKARGMAREFQRSLEDMAREADLQDIKAEVDKLSRADVRSRIEETIDPDGKLRRGLAPPNFDHERGDDYDDGADEPELPALPPPAEPQPATATTATKPAPAPAPAAVASTAEPAAAPVPPAGPEKS